LYADQKDEARLKGAIYFSLFLCLAISLFLAFFVAVFSRFVAINIFHSQNLVKLLPLIVFAIPAGVIRDVIGGILRGYKETLRSLLPENLISPSFRLGIFLFLALNGVSPYHAIIAYITGEILSALLSIKFLLGKIKNIVPVKRVYERKKILEVALTIILTGISVLLYTQADIVILGMFTSTETVGIYGVASKLVLLVYFPMMAFSTAIPPLISSIHTSGDLSELRKIVSESTRWILSTAMPIILILSLEGKYILKYFYGPEFTAG
jgi:O-antigen/teichoic acid export membrane protein